jgi:hypothetical protein
MKRQELGRTVQTSTGDMFKRFDAEAFIVRRLAEHGKGVFAGITDPDERRERIRFAIIEGGLDCTIIGRKHDSKKPETYAEAFERLYGEPLEPKRKGNKRCSV